MFTVFASQILSQLNFFNYSSLVKIYTNHSYSLTNRVVAEEFCLSLMKNIDKDDDEVRKNCIQTLFGFAIWLLGLGFWNLNIKIFSLSFSSLHNFIVL